MAKLYQTIMTVLMLILVAPVSAQHAALDPLEVQPSGEAYAAAIRFRGIDTNVGYFDPTRPPPPLETTQTVRQERERDVIDGEINVTGGSTIIFVLALMIVMGIAYVFVAYGGRLPVSFARDPQDAAKTRQTNVRADHPGAPGTRSLQAILNMTDRTEALVALCKALLARVVAREGVLQQKSWTDRDTLRRVPRGNAHFDALQALVFESERVQFGGRDVTEETFRGYVDKLRPLMNEGPR